MRRRQFVDHERADEAGHPPQYAENGAELPGLEDAEPAAVETESDVRA